MVCRISYFNDILERSVSRSSSFEDLEKAINEKTGQLRDENVPRKPVPLPKDFSYATTLQAGSQQSDRSSWHSGWSRLVSDTGHKAGPYMASKTAVESQSSLESSWSDTSSGSSCSMASSDTLSNSSPAPRKKYRKPTPSSSISSSSRRSPLSTMR